MSEAERYELAARKVAALESIAGSLVWITQYLHRTQRAEPDEHPLAPIPGLDDLGGGKVDGFTPEGHVVDLKTTETSGDESEEVDAASLAREAEALLNAAATPQIKGRVEIGEGEKPTRKFRIDLFKQEKKPIDQLIPRKSDDPVLVRAYNLAHQAKELTHGERVFVAAVELVYSNLPEEMWGTADSAAQIKLFSDSHEEDQG